MCLYFIHTGCMWKRWDLNTSLFHYKARTFFTWADALSGLNIAVFLLLTLTVMKDSVQDTSLMLWLRRGRAVWFPQNVSPLGFPVGHLTQGPCDWPYQGEPVFERRQSCLLSDSRDWISISYEGKDTTYLFHSLKVFYDPCKDNPGLWR